MIELELKLLETVEKNQNCTQRELVESLGMGIGKINFFLKAFTKKSYVKFENFSKNPNKLGYAYLLTPKRMAEKIKLIKSFLIWRQAEFDCLQIEIAC